MDDLKQQLFDRLDKNLADYHELIVGFDKREIIEMADRIVAYSDAYAYLTNNHDFEDFEVDYLLKFHNPLEVVTDEWQRRREDISDMSFALHHVFDKQDALQEGYALVSDAPARQSDSREQKQAPSVSPESEPAHDGVDKVHGYTIKQSVLFTNDRGFALAENPNAPSPFVTWQLTEENGKREHFWGHYFSDVEKAAADFAARVTEYKNEYGVSEKKPSIIAQLKTERQAHQPEKPPKVLGVSKDEQR